MSSKGSLSVFDKQSGRYYKFVEGIPTDLDRRWAQTQYEIDWCKYLAKKLNGETIEIDIPFDDSLLQRQIELEEIKKHDVKAIELSIAEKIDPKYRSLVHCFFTSEDVNSFGNIMLMRKATDKLLEGLENLFKGFDDLIERSHYQFIEKTHGQDAVVDWLDEKFRKFKSFIQEDCRIVMPHKIKLGGAIGNFAESERPLKMLYNLDIHELADEFIESFQMTREHNAFQTTNYAHYYDHFSSLKKLCLAVSKIAQDFWVLISKQILGYKITKTTVGSSMMPQKINPIDFENAQGNAQIAVGLLDALCNNLMLFRDARDLRDSTMLRNLPEIYARIFLFIKTLLQGINKCYVTEEQKNAKFTGSVYAATLQTYLRLEGKEDAYETLRVMTQGVDLSREELYFKIEHLFDNKVHLAELMDIKPEVIESMRSRLFVINTSNVNKQKELKEYFEFYKRTVLFTDIDLKEPDTQDTNIIICYKASQVKGSLVSDSVIEINEGQAIVDIRWKKEDLLKNYLGKEVTFVEKMGYYDESIKKVKIFKGMQRCTVVSPRGTGGFGFDDILQPFGSSLTYAQFKDPAKYPRVNVVSMIIRDEYCGGLFDPIYHWNGKFQN